MRKVYRAGIETDMKLVSSIPDRLGPCYQYWYQYRYQLVQTCRPIFQTQNWLAPFVEIKLRIVGVRAVPATVFLASKISYLLSPNLTQKTETGTPNSIPPGPITPSSQWMASVSLCCAFCQLQRPVQKC